MMLLLKEKVDSEKFMQTKNRKKISSVQPLAETQEIFSKRLANLISIKLLRNRLFL